MKGEKSRKKRYRNVRWINEIVYDVLDDILKKAGTHRAAVIWADVVGEKIAKYTKPKGVHRRVLIIEVANPVWRQQIEFLKDDILKKMNDKLPEKRKIKKIKFTLGNDSNDIKED